MTGKNAEFREIHEYYLTRRENPLKKMQSVVAVACKIIRLFYTILTKGVDYDVEKLIHRYRQHRSRRNTDKVACHGWIESLVAIAEGGIQL